MPTFEYGDRITVQALRQKSNADWGKHAKPYDRDLGFYSPPPGWAILSNRVIVHSENNGSFSIATFAGGSNFEERQSIEHAFNNAISAAVDAGDFSAQADFEEQKQMMLSSMDAYSASHNTIRLETEAWKAGWKLDRWGGWCDVSVEVELMFICEPGCADDLEHGMIQQIQAPIDQTGAIGTPTGAMGAVIAQDDPRIFTAMPGLVNGRTRAFGTQMRR